MKSKFLLQFAIVFLMSQFFLSCSPKEHFRFSSHPESYQKVKTKPGLAAAPETPGLPENSLHALETTHAFTEEEPVLEANAGTPVPVISKKMPFKKANTNVRPEVAPPSEKVEMTRQEMHAL